MYLCHSDSRVMSGRFFQPASSDGGICSAQSAAGADLSVPGRKLKERLLTEVARITLLEDCRISKAPLILCAFVVLSNDCL
jgi:hypothetical protein